MSVKIFACEIKPSQMRHKKKMMFKVTMSAYSTEKMKRNKGLAFLVIGIQNNLIIRYLQEKMFFMLSYKIWIEP